MGRFGWLKIAGSMKIKYFKINSPFRGLPSGFSLKFRNHNFYPSDNDEPICLVGINGSGKSNTLQVLAELFYYIEIQTMEISSSKTDYGFLDFELHYEISKLKWKTVLNKSRENIPIKEDSPVEIHWTKLKGQNLIAEAYDKDSNANAVKLSEYLWDVVLPNKVIGYSSGQNELISSPFIKLDYHYFERYNQSLNNKDSVSSSDINRMFFMDYESNEIVLIANYIFESQHFLNKNQITKLNKKLGIESLHSFSFQIRFSNYEGKAISFPSEINVGIEKLKQCATAWHDNIEDVKSKRERIIKLNYYVDTATEKAFRNIFKTPFELFRLLYLLRMMNIYGIKPNTRKNIRETGQGVNVSDLVPRHEKESLIFTVSDIKFKKFNVKELVRYKHLSDGEHQLLHVMGTIKMMSESDVLFLLDEPETHFNPDWRAKMIRYIMEVNKTEHIEHDHFITSHSPFIISDCKPTNVYLFYRDKGKLQFPVQTAHERRLNTFGTSVNILTEEVFNKHESQGEYSGITIRELMDRNYDSLDDIKRAMEDARVLGDSVEKTLLFRKLIMIEEKLKSRNKPNKK